MTLDPVADASNAQRLQKSRRNVMLSATMLAVVLTTGADVGGVSVQGTTLTFARKELLQVWLWVILGYFWLRYVQHLKDCGPRPLGTEQWGLVHAKASDLAKGVALATIKQTHPEYKDLAVEPVTVLRTAPFNEMLNVDPWSFVKRGWTFDVTHVYLPTEPQSVGKVSVPLDPPFSVHLPNKQLLLPRIYYAAQLGVTRTGFTEHVLPLLAPFMPLAIKAWAWISEARVPELLNS